MGSRRIALSSFNLGARWGECSTPHPGRFNPYKRNRYPLYRTLVRSQGRSGQVRKMWPQTGFDPRTDQLVETRRLECNVHSNYWCRQVRVRSREELIKPIYKSCRNYLAGYTASHTVAMRNADMLIWTNGFCFGCVYEVVCVGFVFENPDPYFYRLNTPTPPHPHPNQSARTRSLKTN